MCVSNTMQICETALFHAVFCDGIRDIDDSIYTKESQPAAHGLRAFVLCSRVARRESEGRLKHSQDVVCMYIFVDFNVCYLLKMRYKSQTAVMRSLFITSP